MNIIRNKLCQNWSRTCTYRPELFFQPTTTDEVREVLKRAEKDGKKVRCIGGGASMSSICDTNEYIISMTKYNKVLKIDPEKKQVTVQSGITMDDLNHALDKEGLAMIELPLIGIITAGGLLGTGVHGSGKTTGIVPSYVTELEMMLANGDILKCSKAKEVHLFNSALVNLGVLGVVLNVTFQCEDSSFIRQSIQSMPFEEGLESFATAESLHGRYCFIPYADRIAKIEIEKCKEKIPSSSPLASIFLIPLRISGLLEFIFLLGVYMEFLMPWIAKLFHYLALGRYTWSIDKSFKILHIDCLFASNVSEYAIPIEKATAFLREFRKLFLANKLKLPVPVDIRFAKADEIYLSQCYKRDCCYISALCFRPFGKEMGDQKRYFEIYENLMRKYHGRPHFGKEHNRTAKDFRELYPKFDEFLKIRKSLDPNNLFVNDHVKRHFLSE